MYVHWQPRTRCVVAEIPEEQARKLVGDLTMLTRDAAYSTKAVEILIGNLRKGLESA